MTRLTKGLAALLAATLASCATSGVGAEADFDPRDFTGIWVIDRVEPAVDERFSALRPPDEAIPPGLVYRGAERHRVISTDRPPFTPEGEARFAQSKNSYGDPWTGRPPAPITEWNDPIDYCDPDGYPRLMFGYIIQVMRFVQTPTVVLQMFERPRMWRDIWVDGRGLHENPEPTFYGYAAGRWEGDTLVVESNGFNDRAWLDSYGHPRSDEMRMVERFTRVAPDRMRWEITLIDPVIFTEPWVGEKTLTLHETSPRSSYEELREDLCVWSDVNQYWETIDTWGEGNQLSTPAQVR
jgi:hypothetical protein